jgi:hypothetical protein
MWFLLPFSVVVYSPLSIVLAIDFTRCARPSVYAASSHVLDRAKKAKGPHLNEKMKFSGKSRNQRDSLDVLATSNGVNCWSQDQESYFGFLSLHFLRFQTT